MKGAVPLSSMRTMAETGVPTEGFRWWSYTKTTACSPIFLIPPNVSGNKKFHYEKIACHFALLCLR